MMRLISSSFITFLPIPNHVRFFSALQYHLPSSEYLMGTQPSPPETLPFSPYTHNPTVTPLADTIRDDEYIMVGSNLVPLHRTNMKNHSLPSSSRYMSSTDKHPLSDPLPSHLFGTVSDYGKFKRRPQVVLGSFQARGERCVGSSSSSSSARNSLSLAETLPTAKMKSHHDQSLQHSHLGKKKAASANRQHNCHNFNYAAAGRKSDSFVSLPKFRPFDICFPGKQDSAFIDATLPEQNSESCIESQEGGSKERILRSGMVLLKHYIIHDEQVEIVKTCCELGLGPGGFYQPGYADGAKLRLQMMCLGLDWDPQTRKYGDKRMIDGSKPPSIPHHFSKLVKRAIQKAHYVIKERGVSYVDDIFPSISPDICIVNFYTTNGRLGLHQDRDESSNSLRKGLPVVSFSIGDSAEFLYGDERDVDKAEKVLLESGDVLIFGGESRLVFHGVSSIIPNSAPKELLKDTLLRPGRLNLTFRQY